MSGNKKKKKDAAFKIDFARPKRPRALLVDADILAYQAVSEGMEEVRTPDDEWTYRVDMKKVRQMVEERVLEHMADLKAKAVVMAFGSRSNWRKRVMAEYKANRTGKKPLGYWDLVKWMSSEWPTKTAPDLEADDVIGLMATSAEFMPDHDKIVVSEDKDFQGVPCQLWSPRKPELGIRTIGEADADMFHMRQTLTGDRTDGYPGCPGVGEVGAEKVLRAAIEAIKNPPTVHELRKAMWKGVVAAYADKELGEDVALQNARVARILRASDFAEDGKVVLWNPPSGGSAIKGKKNRKV